MRSIFKVEIILEFCSKSISTLIDIPNFVYPKIILHNLNHVIRYWSSGVDCIIFFVFQIISVVSVFFILTSIFSFCLKTHPNCRVPVIRNVTYHRYPAVRVSLEVDQEYRSQDEKHQNHGNYSILKWH